MHSSEVLPSSYNRNQHWYLSCDQPEEIELLLEQVPLDMVVNMAVYNEDKAIIEQVFIEDAEPRHILWESIVTLLAEMYPNGRTLLMCHFIADQFGRVHAVVRFEVPTNSQIAKLT